MNKLEPCPFCGGTKIWIGTIAECEMQDKNRPDYEFNSEHYIAVCDYLEGGCGASWWKRKNGRRSYKSMEQERWTSD